MTTTPRIFHRDQWQARPPKHTVPRPVSNIRTVFAHYSDQHESIPSPSHAHDVFVVQGIQNYHMDVKGYFDIAYAALIGGNGDIYLGRANDVVQAAVQGHNATEWSAAFLSDGPITDAQWQSFVFLMFLADLNFPFVSHVPEPHSAGSATHCPGGIIRAKLASTRW